VKWILAAGLAIAVAAISYAWQRGGDETSAGEPLVVGERRHHVLPAKKHGAPLLVLLHQRGGTPREILWAELFDALEAEGASAPAVLLVDGGDHSYYHDRDDFDWGTHVLRDAIPAARRRLNTDPGREAIGGFSMGGFGALDLARQRRFCAVGGHSAALWLEAGETPEGAFDDAEDFERHDLIGFAHADPRLFRGARVWLDSGSEDPFRPAMLALSAEIDVRPRIWPGDHSTAYWRDHVDEYVRFYADALRRC
jgi:S-formylglutathione hydrolase FrmB